MMAAHDEEAKVRRIITLAEARRLCGEWGYWCYRTQIRTGYEPTMSTGGIERQYRSPPQWHPAEPRMPEPNEISGLDVQRAFIDLPKLYRGILRAEYCLRPWIVPVKDGELEVMVARYARISLGAYGVTLERALLALANVMKRKNLWRGA